MVEEEAVGDSANYGIVPEERHEHQIKSFKRHEQVIIA